MWWGGILLLLSFSLLLVDGRGGDAAKGNVDDLLMPTSTNVTVEDSTGRTTVSVSTKAKVEVNGWLQEEIKSNSENINGVNNLTIGDDKHVTESVAKEGKGSDSQLPKENARLEKCDTINSCMHEKNKLIACLRVPGNDSPTLSLLIQNKGTVPFTVGISVPDFVKIEQRSILLTAKEDRKVKVSFENGVSNNSIFLTAAEWHCNLNFWDMIPDSVVKNEHSFVPAKAKISQEGPFILIFLAALVVVGAVFLWIRFKQTRLSESPGYQILENSLPVSNGGMKETDSTDGWDSEWGESWDDEEAPLTPSNPSLNLSSKGLASRRFNKEGWKD